MTPMTITATPPIMTKPDPEVPGKPTKRLFSSEYKRRILDEVEAAAPGEIGAILRREGLYSSHLTDWRRQREAGTLGFNARVKKGRPAKDPRDAEIERLQRENERLGENLRKADLIIEVQKKMALLLDSLPSSEVPPSSSQRRK